MSTDRMFFGDEFVLGALHNDESATGAVPDQITARHLELIEEALGALEQLMYEGSHVRRGVPAPTYDSPWRRPNLPRFVLSMLEDNLRDVRTLSQEMHRQNYNAKQQYS